MLNLEKNVCRLLLIPIFLLLVAAMPTFAEGDGSEWSDLEIIDIHAHVGTFSGYDLSLATLLKNVDKFGIKMALISNIDGSNLPGTTGNLGEKDANDVTAKIVGAHPELLRGLVWARPVDGKVENVEPFFKNALDKVGKKIFVGLKLHPEFNAIAADDPRIDPYLELCHKYSLPAVFHSGPKGSFSDPERIYKIARRHPDVAVVLYHMGFGTDHSQAIEVAFQALKNKDANLYLETSQAAPEAVLRAIRELGSSRVLFGTDATYFGDAHYDEYKELIDALKKLSAQERHNVLHGNAKRLFYL